MSNPTHINSLALDRGLVLQSRSPVHGNEAGMKEATIDYLLWNKDYPRLIPARGAAPMRSGDCDLSFLGKHSESFTRNGSSPGVGLLEVLYRGAVFPEGSDFTDPYIQSRLTKTVINIALYTKFGSDTTWSHYGNAVITYEAIELTYSYVSRFRLGSSHFLAGAYTVDDDHPAPEITTLVATNAFSTDVTIKDADGRTITVPGGFSNIIPNPDYKPSIIYTVEPADFQQKQCGRVWEVTEVGKVSIQQSLPTPLTAYIYAL